MTPILGQTEKDLKTTERSLAVLPETVIYEVDVTMTLPASLAATSGINAIAHAVEALYARDANPRSNVVGLAIAPIEQRSGDSVKPGAFAETEGMLLERGATNPITRPGCAVRIVAAGMHAMLCPRLQSQSNKHGKTCFCNPSKRVYQSKFGASSVRREG